MSDKLPACRGLLIPAPAKANNKLAACRTPRATIFIASERRHWWPARLLWFQLV